LITIAIYVFNIIDFTYQKKKNIIDLTKVLETNYSP